MDMSISLVGGEDNCQQELWSEIAFTIALAQITLLWLWDTLHASPQLMRRAFNQICSIVQAVICQSVAIDCFGSFSIKAPPSADSSFSQAVYKNGNNVAFDAEPEISC